MERWGDDRNLLGLGNRGANDGLFGIAIGWEVNGRGSDGSVVVWRRDFGPRLWWWWWCEGGWTATFATGWGCSSGRCVG